MDDRFFSTGQAAHELGVSQAQIRALCEAGVAEAKYTSGGQWRIPTGEVERLKRDGLPQIPRPLPNHDGARNRSTRAGGPPLLGEPSDDAVTAVEQVTIAKAMLEDLRTQKEIEQERDWTCPQF